MFILIIEIVEVLVVSFKAITLVLILQTKIFFGLHEIELLNMKIRISFLILLAYFAQNGCFCDEDVTPKPIIPPEKYRLPRSVFPELYTLNVFTHINDDEGYKFNGDVRIQVIYLGFSALLFQLA